MTARAPVYIDSGKLHVFEDGDTLPPWLSPSSMAWANLTGVPAGITQLAALTGPGYAKVDAAGAWSVRAAIPQADVSGLATALAGLQPISARLAAIAGLTDAAGWLHDDGSGNWALTTPTKSDVGLSLVENTALSTWGGSTSLTTLGTVASGIWHGTAIADSYIASAATWNAKEGGLGNPSVSGQVLASTTAGARSWVSLPAASTTTPAALGIAAVGAGTTWARADHIHAMPTASQVGAEPALGSPSTSGYLLSSTSAGARSWAAPYSLPTATASVLGGVKVGTGLAIASGVLSVAYGTAAGTACVGNDSRLSDSRTPTAHALDGALHTISGKTAGQVLVATGATTFGFATISGDATLSGAGALTLATLLTAGSAGSATAVPTLTWDAKGRLTAAGSAAISIPHTQISDWGTYINQALLTTSSPTFGAASLGTWVGGNSYSWTGFTGCNSTTWSGYMQSSTETLIGAVSGGSISLAVAQTRVLTISGSLVSTTLPLTVTGLITANGGISGNLTGHASLDLPLTGGTMSGNLLGGTPYNIGAASNWWGSIYATTIYESNVALSSKYLGINASIPHTQISDWGTYINQPLLTTSSPTFGQLRIGSVDNPLIRLVSDGSINVRAIAGHEFVVATPTDPYSSDGLSLMFSGSEGDPVAIKAGAFYASGFYEGGVALSSKYLQANQSISLTGAVSGSGTTSITTSFANTHLAGINQELTTTSSPTFGAASLGTWVGGNNYSWTGFTGCNNMAWSGYMQSSTETLIGAVSGGSISLAVAQTRVLTISGSLVSTTLPLTVTGLITANGGISGNLTGHASLDIPLTGSSAITGELTSSNSSNIGSTSSNWGTVYATSVRSTGTSSISSFALSGDVLTLSHSFGDLTWVNTIRGSVAGLVLQNAIISGTFSPEVNRQSSNYTITREDQGKMVISINTLNLPSLTEHDAGFWCLVNWHVGGGQAVFGPTTSGTTWILRGQYLHVSTSTPFTGIVSWDGYSWYAG